MKTFPSIFGTFSVAISIASCRACVIATGMEDGAAWNAHQLLTHLAITDNGQELYNLLTERGIDISGEYPKPWTDETVRAARA